MTSKLVVNTIEADTGISSVSFASSISMNSTAKFHFSAAGVDIGADTNINRPAAGVLGFNINSSEKGRIDSSGRLLLGTTTEGHTSGDDLTIATSDTTGITLRGGSSGGGRIFFSDGTSGDAEYEGVVGYDHGTNHLYFSTNHAERLRITSAGAAVVGGTSAQASDAVTLMPDGEVTAAGFYFSNNIGAAMNNTGIRRHTTNTMVFDTDSTERLRISSDGYVGINETSPIHQLSIGINTATAWSASKNISNTTNNDFIGLNLTNSNSAANAEVGIMFQATTSGAGQYSINCRKSAASQAELIFRTRDGGSASKEVLKIDAGGRTKFMGTRAGSLQPEDTDSVNLYTKSTNNSVDRCLVYTADAADE
mgnify:CR=1 FL=1